MAGTSKTHSSHSGVPESDAPERVGFDPLLDPLHAAPGGAHRRRRDLSRFLPYYIVLFVLAPLVQYLVHELAGR